jgi:hypothetical protein
MIATRTGFVINLEMAIGDDRTNYIVFMLNIDSCLDAGGHGLVRCVEWEGL